MNRFSALVSLARAGFVLAREGAFLIIPADDLPLPARIGLRIANMLARKRAAESARSERLSKALNRLGPSWVKLGQFLATRPDVVGVQIAGDLELLQDQMEAFATSEAKAAIESSLGRPMDDMFATFDEPIAGAPGNAQR